MRIRNGLLFLALGLLVGTVAAARRAPLKDCIKCTLPSSLYCWADYGELCKPPTGPDIIGHCTESQARQFCLGHAALFP